MSTFNLFIPTPSLCFVDHSLSDMAEISPAGCGFFISLSVSLVSQLLFKRNNALDVVMPSDSFNSPNTFKKSPALP